MNARKSLVAAIAAAGASVMVCITTLVKPRWFEFLFGSAPDDGDGSVETLIAVMVSLLACFAFTLLARREWRRMHTAPTPEAHTGR